MTTQILNVWKSTKTEKQYFTVDKPIYVNGDYRIYKQFSKSYLYTYKNIGINQLAGINKNHLDSLANRVRPEETKFLYDGALKTLNKGLNILQE